MSGDVPVVMTADRSDDDQRKSSCIHRIAGLYDACQGLQDGFDCLWRLLARVSKQVLASREDAIVGDEILLSMFSPLLVRYRRILEIHTFLLAMPCEITLGVSLAKAVSVKTSGASTRAEFNARMEALVK